jgi:ribosomal protein S18 acetylase RimI-like enzyme
MSIFIDDVYKVQKKDVSKAVSVLVDAFQHDPVWNKLFEGESKVERKYHAFFDTPVRYCMKFGQVIASSEKLEGVAAWVPGDHDDMTFWRMMRSGALTSAMKIGARLGKKMKDILQSLPEDRKQNMGDAPYIYIFLVGVSSKYQGKGFGSKLIRAVIERSEGIGVSLYLETETENNVALYEKFGFEVVKIVTLPVINLPMWEMVRAPVK